MYVERDMARTNAREPLINAARDLFSLKGYNGTTVDEIAESIGIKGPTIYKYFKNKDDLLKAVIDSAEDEYIKGMGMDKDLPDKIVSARALKEYVLHTLHFTLSNETAIKMRRLMTMEQFRNETLSRVTTLHQITYLQDVYVAIFDKLMKRNLMVKGDVDTIALEFISPVTIMIQMLEREPEKKEEALQKIEKHIDVFIERYEIQ